MKKSEQNGLICVLSAAILWGTAGLFVRGFASYGIREMQIVFLRALFTTVLMTVLFLLTDRSAFRIRIRDLWLFAASGILSVALFNFCYYKTIALSTLSVAAVLMYTAPFYVVFLSALFFHEPLTFRKLIACCSAFLGCCLVSGLFDSAQRIGGKCLLFGLLTGFGYSLYTVFGNLLLARGYRTTTITYYTFVFSMLATAPLVPLKITLTSSFSSVGMVLLVLAMAIVQTILPYILYTSGLKNVEGGKALIAATVEPVVATLLGVIIYREKLTVVSILGILFVLGAVVILNLKSGEKNETESIRKNQSVT